MSAAKTWRQAPAGHVCCWRCHRYRDPVDLAEDGSCEKDCTVTALTTVANRYRKPPKKKRAAA